MYEILISYYYFRAVNKAGQGEPSESTQPHLAKPRNLAPRIDRTNIKEPIIIKAGLVISLNVDVRGEPPPSTFNTVLNSCLSDLL